MNGARPRTSVAASRGSTELRERKGTVNNNTEAELDALEGAIAQGDTAARWFLRALARGETPTREHARRVAELEALQGAPDVVEDFAR